MAPTPDVTVIISNYEPKGRLVSCIEHALGQDGAAGHFEVVFVVHGHVSQADLDAMQAMAAADSRLRILTSTDDHRARALNAAVRAARAETVVFLESHVHAPPSLVGALRSALDGVGVTVVQGAFAASPRVNWVSDLEDTLRRLACDRRVANGLLPDEYHLHSAALRKEAILAAGGFDERIPVLAEVVLIALLVERAGRAGLVHLTSPAVHHFNHEDWPGYIRALRRRGRDVGRLWRDDPERAARLYPSAILTRHLPAILRTRWLCVAATAIEHHVAGVMLFLSRHAGPSRLTVRAARLHVATAVRLGVFDAIA